MENEVIREAHDIFFPPENYAFFTATFLDSAYGEKSSLNQRQPRDMYSDEQKGWKERRSAVLYWRGKWATAYFSCWSSRWAVFGHPVRFISDRGGASNIFQEHISKLYRQIERVNRCIISIIAKLSAEDPSKWYKLAAQVQGAINSHVHSSTKKNPSQLLIGVQMQKLAIICRRCWRKN